MPTKGDCKRNNFFAPAVVLLLNIVVSLTSAGENSIRQFDIIIVGAGCAGLSLAVRLAGDEAFKDKQILIVDKAPKSLNDRTWCFWERQPGYFEKLVHHCWDELFVKHFSGEKALSLHGYSYKMIRGIDFYRNAFGVISHARNVQVHYAPVKEIDAASGMVTTTDSTFKAGHIFSSVLSQDPVFKPGEFYLLQHFRGWWIETAEDFFNPAQADLMNFRTSQQHGCAFVYMLPVSSKRALVEYTLFTEETLQDDAYDDALKQFITAELKLENYTITEVENGIIPMTNLRFPVQQGKVTYIGTAGGQTKASTGFTFQFIQKHSHAIVHALKQSNGFNLSTTPARFRFYDSVLLRVLHERKIDGADVFYQLFKNNPASRVLRFLDNESSFLDELLIMNSTPKNIFVPAAMKELH